MITIGIHLMIFGIGSLILNKFGVDFVIISWANTPTKIGMIVVGALLYYFAPPISVDGENRK